MNYTHELTRLVDFVREIRANHKLNRTEASGPLVLSKALVSIALNGLNEKDIDALIESLEVERYIRLRGQDQLLFPASFIEGDKWISSYADYGSYADCAA